MESCAHPDHPASTDAMAGPIRHAGPNHPGHGSPHSCPTHLMAALHDHPIGIRQERPHLWWEDPILDGCGWQKAYEIRLAENGQTVASTGWVESDSSTAVAWSFAPLAPLEHRTWQVRVQMTNECTAITRCSAWSAPQTIVRGSESADLWQKALPLWSPSGTPITARHPGPAHSGDGRLTLTLPVSCPPVTLLARAADDGNDGYAWTIDLQAGTLTASRKMNGVLTPLAKAALPHTQSRTQSEARPHSDESGVEAHSAQRASGTPSDARTLTFWVDCHGSTASVGVDGAVVLRQKDVQGAGDSWGVQAGGREARICSARLEGADGRLLTDVDSADSTRPLPWFARRESGMMVVPAGSAGMFGEPGAGDYWALLRRVVDLPEGTISSALVFASAADPVGGAPICVPSARQWPAGGYGSGA